MIWSRDRKREVWMLYERANVARRLRHHQRGRVVEAMRPVLAMVGTKMLAHHWLQEFLGEHFNLYMLGAIVLILGTGIGASLLVTERKEASEETAHH